MLADERKETDADFWSRANHWFNRCSFSVRKVLTDNGSSCYRPRAFRHTLGDIGHRRTQPYRPKPNGMVERFHRGMADEWAYARLYTSDAERCAEYPRWLHTYNRHRGHTRTRRSTTSQPRTQPLRSGQLVNFAVHCDARATLR
jgi:transposase InsO family protein